MPASASPQYPHSQHNLTNQPTRTVLPPIHAHEQTGQGGSQRPGSGMSISAMLGVDAGSSREGKGEANGAHPRANPSLGQSFPQSSPGPAPNTQPLGGISLDRYKTWYPENSRAPHAHSATLPHSPFSDSRPTQSPSFGPPLRASLRQSPPRTTGYSEASSPSNNTSFTTRKYSLSDPNQFGSDRLFGPRLGGDDGRSHGGQYRPVNRAQLDNNARPTFSKEASEEQNRNGATYLAPKQNEEHANPNGATPSSYSFKSRAPQPSTDLQRSFSSDSRTEPGRLVPEAPLPRRGNLPTVPSLESHLHRNESALAALRNLDEPRRSSIPLSESPELRRDSPLSHLQRQLAASAAGADDGGSSPEQGRKLLSLLNDNKRGRVSPLPQAVQGAQAQLRGPASEPGIKNEFARIFPGIGSGVGSAVSTPVPPDNTHPPGLPSSPEVADDVDRRTPVGRRKELIDESKPRNSSRTNGRRPRKSKEDEIKKELDEASGTGLVRTSSTRGQKRARNNYQNLGNLTQG